MWPGRDRGPDYVNRQNSQHFYKFAERISYTEHWKLVAESSEFHLTLSRAHRAHFFQLEISKKKRDILSEKRESGMALKKREFTPESGNVDTYAYANHLSKIGRKGVPDFRSRKVYCGFPGVCSYLLYVICILVSEFMLVYILSS